jgi:hypothetical protein
VWGEDVTELLGLANLQEWPMGESMIHSLHSKVAWNAFESEDAQMWEQRTKTERRMSITGGFGEKAHI